MISEEENTIFFLINKTKRYIKLFRMQSMQIIFSQKFEMENFVLDKTN